MIKKLISIIVILLISGGLFSGYRFFMARIHENKILREVIERLGAESRVAEVLVTDVEYNEERKEYLTTIKFLEYDSYGQPMEPKHFTFSGNIIQFQSLVVRFDDMFIKKGDPMKGRSMHLFRKVFMLNGKDTEEYEITSPSAIPAAYKIEGVHDRFEDKIWKKFWRYALDPQEAEKIGIKNAQIEAPGTMFIPGTIYTIKIEHDGGMRIDALPIPEILRGELIP